MAARLPAPVLRRHDRRLDHRVRGRFPDIARWSRGRRTCSPTPPVPPIGLSDGSRTDRRWVSSASWWSARASTGSSTAWPPYGAPPAAARSGRFGAARTAAARAVRTIPRGRTVAWEVRPDEVDERRARWWLQVVPSRYDGWGLIVAEAMAMGLPVLASPSVGAALDLIRPGFKGDPPTPHDPIVGLERHPPSLKGAGRSLGPEHCRPEPSRVRSYLQPVTRCRSRPERCSPPPRARCAAPQGG